MHIKPCSDQGSEVFVYLDLLCDYLLNIACILLFPTFQRTMYFSFLSVGSEKPLPNRKRRGGHTATSQVPESP